MIDRVIRRARLGGELRDIGVAGGRIVAIEPHLVCDAPETDAQGCLVCGGLIETHIHLDKTCILDRCAVSEGSVAEAVRLTSLAKRDFTAEDVYARGARTLARCLSHGTTRMRTHVELDPGIGLRGLEGVEQLARDFAWGMELQICVFPQEGMLNNPGTEELLIEGLKRGAPVIGAVPYIDSNPRGQIDRIFEIAREFGADIDMHLDMGDTPEGMQALYVAEKTAQFGWGGRVSIGHVTQMSSLPGPEFDTLARQLGDAGVTVAVLPATDLFLVGRGHDHAKPRCVVEPQRLLAQGCDCTISTNNVLNPFTPYGDGSLVRMANLAANVAQVSRPEELAECFAMISTRSAKALRLTDYGVAVGNPADLVAFDAPDAASVVAELAQALWGMKAGRPSFNRPRPTLNSP
jgi:cytosine deaminase